MAVAFCDIICMLIISILIIHEVMDLDTSFHYLLMASQGLFQRKVMARLAEHGLTAGQPKVLDYLGLHDGSVQKAIAAGCQIEPATLTGILSRMEEKGLLYRQMENGDRRSLHVYLTEEGKKKQKLVRQTLEDLTQELLGDMQSDERQALLAGLMKICSKMIDTEVLQ